MILISRFGWWRAVWPRRSLESFRFPQIWSKLVLASLLPGFSSFAQLSDIATNGTAAGSSEGYGSVFADAIDGNRIGDFYNSGSVWHTVIPDASIFYEVDLGGTF